MSDKPKTPQELFEDLDYSLFFIGVCILCHAGSGWGALGAILLVLMFCTSIVKQRKRENK